MVVATIKGIIPSKILVLGAYGMLGHALQEAFPGAVLRGSDLDITDEKMITRFIRKQSPTVVINSAAYTDVDGCEDNREHALAVNGEAPGYIAKACNDTGAILVHYSTDYVFDGSKKQFREDDPTNPINVYGESKQLGERNIIKYSDNFRIIRTSWLFGKHGKNFVDTILTLSRQMNEVRVVDDQVGKPTYTVDLVEATKKIISFDTGIYHVTNDGTCSWYEFACAFIDNAIPCSSAEFPRKAKRPAYSVLENTKIAPLRHWRDALKDYIRSKG
jgi:dTDP-4-dehydrorhamnose reductase